MRIQHNIMAMSAYRNYTNNVSAMKKNLEKLSSGYKINRAGDDAAGLAISEKMRAQITGLETAQKNAKDGISLVQTAEGALTEVHDMLNRMVELATQSANGTYSDTTDREQLQKEIVQLKDEINRIADSSNFNGIKLLDGSMSGREAQTIVDSKVTPGVLTNFKVGGSSGGLGAITTNGTLGVNTFLHVDKGTDTNGTVFSVDLHNVGFDNKAGTSMAINVGGNTIVINGTGGKMMKESELVDYIVDAFQNGNTNVAVNGTSLTGGNATISLTDGTNTGIEFTLSKGTTATGAGDDRLVFTQKNPPTSTTNTFDGRLAVTVTGAGALRGDMMKGEYTVSTAAGTAATVTVTSSADWSGIDGTTTAAPSTGTLTLTFADNTTATVNLNVATTGTTGVATTGTTVGIIKDGDNFYLTDSKGRKTSTLADATNIATALTSAANNAIAAKNEAILADLNSSTNLDSLQFDVSAATTKETIGNITITAANHSGGGTALNAAAGNKIEYTVTGGSAADYNVKTTYVDNKTLDATPRLASTKFTLTADMIEENSSIFIGGTDYVFTSDKALKGEDNYVYIGDLGPNKDGKALTTADLNTVADRLATAAKGNSVYTVGNTKGSADITVVEIEGNDQGVKNGFDLKTQEGIEASLGFRVGNKVETTTTEIEAGKKLTLQIGDTADAFNQLSVAIKDCHAEAIGIGDVDVSTQEGAATAVEAIKNAINYVSDVRGTLGATQNRLDHTINNLSVMTENIQDAESTIRDTDVADEMMAYTKNNILIQSAQAMLAQANQVPQGVLQLLQ